MMKILQIQSLISKILSYKKDYLEINNFKKIIIDVNKIPENIKFYIDINSFPYAICTDSIIPASAIIKIENIEIKNSIKNMIKNNV